MRGSMPTEPIHQQRDGRQQNHHGRDFRRVLPEILVHWTGLVAGIVYALVGGLLLLAGFSELLADVRHQTMKVFHPLIERKALVRFPA